MVFRMSIRIEWCTFLLCYMYLKVKHNISTLKVTWWLKCLMLHIIQLGCTKETTASFKRLYLYTVARVICKNVACPQLTLFWPYASIWTPNKYKFSHALLHILRHWSTTIMECSSSIFGIGAIWIFYYRLSITKSCSPDNLRSAP